MKSSARRGMTVDQEYESFTSEEEEEVEENPFKIPTDEQIFESKEKLKTVTTGSGLTFKSPRKTKVSRRDPVLPLIRDKKSKSAPSGDQPVDVNSSYKKKENVSDFIEKKKQMFLLQMSIDTKKFEIKKLEKKAQKRDQKLFQMEQELKQQTQAFDDFLALNDIRAVEAIKKAEEETKAKQSKQNEIKKLNARIAAITSEISKLDYQLDNCRRYKDFLDSLTPKEELAKMNEKKKKISKSRPGSRASSGRSGASTGEREERETKMTPIASLEANEEEQKTENNEEVIDMYFKKPEQLLNIYSELEESNLILIQNTEDIQEQLEDVQKMYKETKKKMSMEAENLQAQIDVLNEQLEIEQDRLKTISDRHSSNIDQDGEERLKMLTEKIKEIYIQSGVETESDQNADIMENIDPLFMLSKIENKLESLLTVLDEYDDDFVAKYEKQREKERRKQQREETNKIKSQKEKKNKSVVQQTAPRKRAGKPLVFRSAPPNTDTKKSKSEETKQNEEKDEFKELFGL